MDATQLVSSVELLVDRSLFKEARALITSTRNEYPQLLSAQGWLNLIGMLPRQGRPKGYKFKREKCPYCGVEVAANWIVRHIKNEHGAMLTRTRSLTRKADLSTDDAAGRQIYRPSGKGRKEVQDCS